MDGVLSTDFRSSCWWLVSTNRRGGLTAAKQSQTKDPNGSCHEWTTEPNRLGTTVVVRKDDYEDSALQFLILNSTNIRKLKLLEKIVSQSVKNLRKQELLRQAGSKK